MRILNNLKIPHNKALKTDPQQARILSRVFIFVSKRAPISGSLAQRYVSKLA